MKWPQTFNIYVMLRNFVCRIGEDADLLMSLYDAKHAKFIRQVKFILTDRGFYEMKCF